MEVEDLLKREQVIGPDMVNDPATAVLFRYALRDYEETRNYLAANVRQLNAAKAGLESALANEVPTADWEDIIRGILQTIERVKVQLELARSKIAEYSGIKYVPQSFS